jgi:hypothetical protein
LVVIETDAMADAEQILDRLTGQQTEIFITDRRGQIWVTSQPGHGVQFETGTANVLTIVPAAKAFFSPENVEPTLVMPRHGVIANRVRLNQFDPSGSIAVILRLAD